ncbi:MAG: hypothetical protein ACPGSB_04325 [Opitutales bacterium]
MDTNAKVEAPHAWSFTHKGGIFQAQIKSAEDLRALGTLDPKLWVALSCPVNDLEIDPRTLALIDSDADGRVRIEEMLEAVKWTLERLAKPDSLFQGGPLPLNAIRASDQEGEMLLASAKRILFNTGHADSDLISVEWATNTESIFSKSHLNGDGVIGPDASEDSSVHKLIGEVIECLGAEKDRNGKPGITRPTLDRFFNELESFDTWWMQGESDAADGENVLPLGDLTPDAFSALVAVEAKVEDYFVRCRIASFDPRSEIPLNRDPEIYKRIAMEDLSGQREDIEAMPLAKITGTSALPLADEINPEWRGQIDLLREKVIRPLKVCDDASLLQAEDWQKLKSQFASYRTWRQSKPETKVESLGIKRVRALLKSDVRGKVEALLEEDAKQAPELKAIDGVEKLARYHRDLITILNNYVNFEQFYDETRSAIFQAGRLFLDGRECRLCLRVNDPAKHSVLATLSRAFVAYCECRRKDSANKFYIAAVFSAGDSANLIVGRNGIFRDRSGKLWDTTIVRIIENPISVREAFLTPYIRIGRFIGEKIEKWAVSRDKAMQQQMQTGIETGDIPATDGTKNNSAQSAGGVAAMLAAGGIALGAVGAGLGSLFRTMKSLTWWELPLVILGVILMISLPSMVIAYLKLRKRTLAPLLDASGWAVNGRTLISPKLGRLLTLRATLPIASTCQLEQGLGARPAFWASLGLTVLATVIITLYALLAA